MKRAFADIPEGQVHYIFGGEGESILLLHQTARSSDEYSEVIPILAKKYRAIAMDTLGYGDSDKPPREYTIADYAKSVISFLDSLGIYRTHLVGHHTGASIALETAANWPDRVKRLVLSGCPYWKRAEERLALLEDKMFKSWNFSPDGSHLLRAWKVAKKSLSEDVSLDLLHRFAMEHLKAGPRGEEAHWAAFRYDPQFAFGRIKCPTLLIIGTNEFFSDVIEDVHNLIRNSKVVIMPGGTNNIAREMPQPFAEVISEFLVNTK